MKGLIAAHSGMRYIVLLVLIIAIVNALINRKSNKYLKKDKILNLFALIFTHLQLLVGLVLYFIHLTMDKGSKVVFSKETMSNGVFRFFTVEHALMMIIAIVLITLGYRKAKKQTDLNKKHQAILWYYGIGLILIFVAIPWPFIYEKLGAGFF